MTEPVATTELSFEDAMRRLEEIVRQLETGEAPLDTAIALYSEGEKLRAHCQQRLENAQARIEKIALDRDGEPVGTTPLDGD